MPIKLKHKGAWHEIADLTTSETGTTKVAIVKDVKAYNVNGGDFTNQEWLVRDLNTISDPNSVGITSTNLGRITVPAGTYSIRWIAPGYLCDRFTSRLVYSTDSTLGVGNSYHVDGTTAYSHQSDGKCVVNSIGDISSITFSATNYLQIEQYSTTGYTADVSGLGVASNISGTDSIFTTLELEDLSSAVLKSTSTGTTKVASVKDEKPINTAGGTITANTWTTRDLNTISDPSSIGITSTTDGVFTLPAGTYKITWRCPSWRVYTYQTKLEYSTSSTFASGVGKVIGSSEFSSSTDDNDVSATSSEGIAPSLTFTQQTYVRIRQWAGVGGLVDGNNLGVASYNDVAGTSSGEKNIFTMVEIEDLATAVKTSTGDGKVINVWNVTYDGRQLIDTETWEDISDLTVTLTPQSASSKFLITAVVNCGFDVETHDGFVRLMRGSTVIGSTSSEAGATADLSGFGQVAGQQGLTGIIPRVITYLDTPNTTAPLTYHVEGRNQTDGKDMLINIRGAGGGNGSGAYDMHTTSQMTIMELRP